jgi:uncharacterized membrane protein
MRGVAMEKNRLDALVDGIFAIVMTLLVMTIVVPQRETVVKEIVLSEFLRSKFHDMVNFALSFALLAIFWIEQHEQARFIRRTDRVHIWITMATLFFVALFPFTTSVVNEYPGQDLAELVFGLNLFIVAALFLAAWVWATGTRRLVDQGTSDRDIAAGRNTCVIFILIALLSVVLSQASPSITSDVFWIVPLMELSGRLVKSRLKPH